MATRSNYSFLKRYHSISLRCATINR
uniref:Uncharacterized protein n=1 Tax=Arundo donax TaxID=35708 RepID=A0A0A8Y677_ARUDO